MLLPEIKLTPRLRALPDLDHYELHAGALTDIHIGRTIAVKTDSAVIAGPLTSLCESRLEGRNRLLLRIGTNSTIGDSLSGSTPRTLSLSCPPTTHSPSRSPRRRADRLRDRHRHCSRR